MAVSVSGIHAQPDHRIGATRRDRRRDGRFQVSEPKTAGRPASPEPARPDRAPTPEFRSASRAGGPRSAQAPGGPARWEPGPEPRRGRAGRGSGVKSQAARTASRVTPSTGSVQEIRLQAGPADRPGSTGGRLGISGRGALSCRGGRASGSGARIRHADDYCLSERSFPPGVSDWFPKVDRIARLQVVGRHQHRPGIAAPAPAAAGRNRSHRIPAANLRRRARGPTRPSPRPAWGSR